jgi:hypothetical protein
MFDLGKGGIHMHHFHAITRRGVSLALIYDDRYPGDRFLPAVTEDGETITVKLPARKDEDGKDVPGEVLRVAVPDFHYPLGCMDVLNLVVMPNATTIPRPGEVMGTDQGQFDIQ